MFLMYVDESGDPGLHPNSPTNYFILTGIVFHELRWKIHLESLVQFRRLMRAKKGLKLREEIHATALINSPGPLVRIKRNDRLDIMRQMINWLANQQDINVISVVVNKKTQPQGTDVFSKAWSTLIQRFENTISYANFAGPKNPDERGMILPDNTDGKKLTTLLRKMRHFNAVPNKASFNGGTRNLKLSYIIEYPFLKDSASSYFHQLCDVVAYCLRQKYEPNNYMKKKGGANLYDRLLPVLVTKASRSNSLGIVEL